MRIYSIIHFNRQARDNSAYGGESSFNSIISVVILCGLQQKKQALIGKCLRESDRLNIRVKGHLLIHDGVNFLISFRVISCLCTAVGNPELLVESGEEEEVDDDEHDGGGDVYD